jgi:hypothetical protein
MRVGGRIALGPRSTLLGHSGPIATVIAAALIRRALKAAARNGAEPRDIITAAVSEGALNG